MTRRLISSGSTFEREIGYSRAVVDGDLVFVSGTTGYDYRTMQMPESAADQARNTLNTIAQALADAGFALADVVRIQITITEPGHMDEIAPVLREFLADVRPASTVPTEGKGAAIRRPDRGTHAG